MSFKARLFGLLPADSFTKSVFTLLSGTTIALALAYLAQPILTRLYSPEDFGLFEAFLAIVSILIPFTSFRYEDALMLPQEDKKASHVLGLSIALILVVCLLSTLLFFFGPRLAAWLQTPDLYRWLLWVPPVLFASRISKVFELWLTRKKRYKPISAGQASQSGVTVTTRVALGSLGSPLGLFVGYFAGQFTTMAGFSYLALRTKTLNMRHILDLRGMLSMLDRYKRFPMFSMPSALLSALITRLPVLLLLFFFNEAVVGYFGRAYALFATPLSLIGAAISQVFFVEGVEAVRRNNLPSFIRKVHGQLMLIGIFPTLAIMLTGPEVLGFILGSAWTVSGEYLAYIAPWLFLASIASPLTRTFDILEKQRVDLSTSIIMFICQTIAFIAGGLSDDIFICLLYVCIGGSTARLIQICVILYIARASLGSIVRDYLNYLALSIPFLVLLFYIQKYESGLLTTTVLGLCCAAYILAGLKWLSPKN